MSCVTYRRFRSPLTGASARSRLGREALVGEDGAASVGEDEAILDLLPVVRRVVAARMRDAHLVDDLVQETLARMMARAGPARAGGAGAVRDRHRAQPHRLPPASGRTGTGARRTCSPTRAGTPTPEDEVLVEERRSLLDEALRRLPERERELLVAHEVEGTDTADAGRRPRLDPGRDRRAAEPQPGQAAGGGAARAGRRAADRPVPAGADRAVQRRAPAPAAARRRRPPAGVRLLRRR